MNGTIIESVKVDVQNKVENNWMGGRIDQKILRENEERKTGFKRAYWPKQKYNTLAG